MPDLDIVPFYHCITAERWETTVIGSNGDEYTVTYGKDHRGDRLFEYDYFCTCPHFKIRLSHKPGQHCKHIKDVIGSGEHCGWMQFLDGGEPIEDPDGHKECPKCFEPVSLMNWGV